MARRCGYYAGCPSTPTHVVEHPVLGGVPTCSRCIERHGLEDRVTARVLDAPTLEAAVRLYLVERGDGARWAALGRPIIEHLLEGMGRKLDAWASSGELECGVDGCSTIMLDPTVSTWWLEYRPGLDASPICSGCLERARRDSSVSVYWWGGES